MFVDILVYIILSNTAAIMACAISMDLMGLNLTNMYDMGPEWQNIT